MLVVIGLSRGDAECAEKNASGSCPSWVRDGRSLINSIVRLRNRNDAQDTALVALVSASPRLRVSAGKKGNSQRDRTASAACRSPSVDSDGDSGVLVVGGDGVYRFGNTVTERPRHGRTAALHRTRIDDHYVLFFCDAEPQRSQSRRGSKGCSLHTTPC